jgi:hypothetical protein
MAYIMEQRAEAYKIASMRHRSFEVNTLWVLLSTISCDIGKNPFLPYAMLNFFNTILADKSLPLGVHGEGENLGN